MIALIGTTASGKSDLALYLARKFDLKIFSIDSLSVFKGVDIASAKPSRADLDEIRHYCIDLLLPSQKCNAMIFYNELQKHANERIIIVGGSGFYLKSIIDGLSPLPHIPKSVESKIAQMSQNKAESYKILTQIDPQYAQKINPNDKYRIQKALEIYLSSGQKPSDFFATHPKMRLDFEIKIYELATPREIVRENIIKRTESMLSNGLIDEVKWLLREYPSSQALKAIGVKEIVSYLSGEITLDSAKDLIIKNTNALAKRQRTFNKTQFSGVVRGERRTLEGLLEREFQPFTTESLLI